MGRVTDPKAALDLKIVETLELHKNLVSIVSHCPSCFGLLKKVKEGQTLSFENNNAGSTGRQPTEPGRIADIPRDGVLNAH